MKNIYPVLFLFFIALLPHKIFAQWSAPVSISPGAMDANLDENMGPCLVSGNDTVYVIWSDRRTQGYAIYFTRSNDEGNTWSTPIAITDTTEKASMPSIAVNGSSVHVVFWDSLNVASTTGLPGNSSWYIHSTDGGNTWSPKVCVDSNTIFWPGVAVHDSTVLVSLDKGVFDSTIICLVKSTDNGNTFGEEQVISTRTGYGRSEDQATATDGHNIHMTWNDNRSGIMEIYYRRSTDMGQTWDPEMAITDTNSYTTMVCLDSGHVDIVYGKDSIYWNSFLRQSSDSGTIFNTTDVQVTSNATTNVSEEYPFMVRQGLNLDLVANVIARGQYYTHSSDGGATWTSQILLGANNTWGPSFIAVTCPVLHVIWPDSGQIYYRRNPTGETSCPVAIATSIINIDDANTSPSIYPDPVLNNATVLFGGEGARQIEVYDITGRQVAGFTCANREFTFSCGALAPGIYFVRAANEKDSQTVKFIKQ